MITVDNRFGVVAKLTARYVVVRSLDGIEADRPERDAGHDDGAQPLVHEPRDSRRACRCRSSYDSDVDRALELMEAAALREPRVLKAPNAPVATRRRASRESGIDLELGVWINDPENGQGNLRERDQPRDPRASFRATASESRIRSASSTSWRHSAGRRADAARDGGSRPDRQREPRRIQPTIR